MANTYKIGLSLGGGSCLSLPGNLENVAKLSSRKGCRNKSAMPLLFHLTPRRKIA